MAALHDEFLKLADPAERQRWLSENVPSDKRKSFQATARQIRARAAKTPEVRAATNVRRRVSTPHKEEASGNLEQTLGMSQDGMARVDFQNQSSRRWEWLTLPTKHVPSFLQQHLGKDVTVTVGHSGDQYQSLNLTTPNDSSPIDASHPTGGRVGVSSLTARTLSERGSVGRPVDSVQSGRRAGPALIPGVGRQIRAARAMEESKRALAAAAELPVHIPKSVEEMGQEVRASRHAIVQMGGELVEDPARIGRPGEIQPGNALREISAAARMEYRERTSPDEMEPVAEQFVRAKDAERAAQARMRSTRRNQARPLFFGGPDVRSITAAQGAAVDAGLGITQTSKKKTPRESTHKYLSGPVYQHFTTDRGRLLSGMALTAEGVHAEDPDVMRSGEAFLGVDLESQMRKRLPPHPKTYEFGGVSIPAYPGRIKVADTPESRQAQAQARAHWIVASHPTYAGMLQRPNALSDSARHYGLSVGGGSLPEVAAAARRGAQDEEERVQATGSVAGLPGYVKRHHPETLAMVSRITGVLPVAPAPTQNRRSLRLAHFLNSARADVSAAINARAEQAASVHNSASEDALSGARAAAAARRTGA